MVAFVGLWGAPPNQLTFIHRNGPCKEQEWQGEQEDFDITRWNQWENDSKRASQLCGHSQRN